MNRLGFFGAAAVASVLCFSSAPALAAADVSGAALDLVVAGTNTGNGGAFVTKAIKDAYDLTDAECRYIWDSASLSSAKWYDEVVEGTYFVEITDIADVAAGQLLVIDAVASPAYAGHTVVVTGAPIDITAEYTPAITGTKQWALPIADSTGSEHGQNASYPDSRRVSGVFTGGVPGTAYMRIFSDADTGEILYYSWSVANTSLGVVYDKSERPFVIAELTLSYED